MKRHRNHETVIHFTPTAATKRKVCVENDTEAKIRSAMHERDHLTKGHVKALYECGVRSIRQELEQSSR